MKLPQPEMLEEVPLTRLNPSQPARAALCSLPVPPGAKQVTAKGLQSQSEALAWWPEWLHDTPDPRRVLLAVSADEELPLTVSPTCNADQPAGEWTGPQWEVRVLEHNYMGRINWEVNELVLQHNGREIGLRLGLDTDTDGLMWWEWLQVEEVWSGPACKAIRAAGYASSFRLTEDHPDIKETRCPVWTHCQHWILCEVYVLLFANGVVHVTARHVNNHLYDNGRDITGAVPVIGLRGCLDEDRVLQGEAVTALVNDVQVCTEECRTMASEAHPGSLCQQDDVAIFRPYEGVEVYLAGFGCRVEGQGFVVRADERVIPAGLGRTVRFCLSFSAAPPRVERYSVPLYWYGMCGEITPEPLLPVADFRDRVIDRAGDWLRDSQLGGCFADGSVPRGGSHYRGEEVAESGWEGETAYNLAHHFHRRPSQENWDAFVRDTYYTADVAVDHVTMQFHMHGYDFGCISPTMNRTLGVLHGYLETGDPYLRDTTEGVALNSFIIDSSNWPRRSYGRDAMFIRGLVALEDYLPGLGYGPRARQAIGRLMQCRRADGSYTDQAGPGGVHAAGNMVVKPWMNLMVLEPMTDWLQRHPDDEQLAAVARSIFDWLLSQFIRQDGEAFWPYESAWGDNPHHPGQPASIHPWGKIIFGYPARQMLFAARFFNEPAYLQAWEDNYRWLGGYDRPDEVPVGGDHQANKLFECLQWHQVYRWRATWEDGMLHVDPYCLPGEECQAVIETPVGPQPVAATHQGIMKPAVSCE